MEDVVVRECAVGGQDLLARVSGGYGMKNTI